MLNILYNDLNTVIYILCKTKKKNQLEGASDRVDYIIKYMNATIMQEPVQRKERVK